MHQIRRLPVVMTSVMIVAVLGACGGAEGDDGAAGDAPLGVAERQATLGMRDIAYEPATLEVGRGEILEIAMSNGGTLAHDFTIEGIEAEIAVTQRASRERVGDSSLHVHLDARASSVVQLRIAEPGTYTYYCSVAGHREAGMEGTLVVQD